MKRRDFITLVGASTVAWPFAAGAQRSDRVPRVLMNLAAEDPESIARTEAFTQGLHSLGWIDGRNVHIDYR